MEFLKNTKKTTGKSVYNWGCHHTCERSGSDDSGRENLQCGLVASSSHQVCSSLKQLLYACRFTRITGTHLTNSTMHFSLEFWACRFPENWEVRELRFLPWLSNPDQHCLQTVYELDTLIKMCRYKHKKYYQYGLILTFQLHVSS